MEPLVPIRVVPQRRLDPKDRAFTPGLWPQYVAGGLYLVEGEDWTGRRLATGVVNVLADPPFLVSRAEVASQGTGALVRVNLFRRDAGWRWTTFSNNLEGVRVLVSVQTSKRHVYTLACTFRDGITLARNPESRAEPRLRPTARGRVHLGATVGQISVRGRPHPVYDHTTISGGAA